MNTLVNTQTETPTHTNIHRPASGVHKWPRRVCSCSCSTSSCSSCSCQHQIPWLQLRSHPAYETKQTNTKHETQQQSIVLHLSHFLPAPRSSAAAGLWRLRSIHSRSQCQLQPGPCGNLASNFLNLLNIPPICSGDFQSAQYRSLCEKFQLAFPLRTPAPVSVSEQWERLLPATVSLARTVTSPSGGNWELVKK